MVAKQNILSWLPNMIFEFFGYIKAVVIGQFEEDEKVTDPKTIH